MNGPSKFFPGSPTCVYNDKISPCFTYISKSNGITSKLLINLLHYFDNLNVFLRGKGVAPVWIMDGHESWLITYFCFTSMVLDTSGMFVLVFPMQLCIGRLGACTNRIGVLKLIGTRQRESL